MPRLIYSLCFYLLLPLVLLRLAYRGLRAPDYRQRIPERFGFFRSPARTGGLWIHAVSVGETIAAAPLIEHFLHARPDLPLVVTTMTPTGSERLRALFGERVFHVYAPYDVPGAVARFLGRTRPAVAVIMETEIWPNLVCQTADRGIPVLLANARLSARSARGYRGLAGLTAVVFRRFHCVMAQAAADAERFVALGVAPSQVQVTGSVKFDVAIPATLRDQARALRASWGTRPVWIAASTHAGEEEILLAAQRRLLVEFPDLLLVLVPRHPERFQPVAELIAQRQLTMCRRGLGELPRAAHQVLLADTMGELMLLYGSADIAFVGGSLVGRGGHNCLEPAAWGLPLVMGPSDFNFAEVGQLLDAAAARQVVRDESALVQALGALLRDVVLRREKGAAASAVVAANRGALKRQLDLIEAALDRQTAAH